MHVDDRRQVNTANGDGVTRSFELVLCPMLFALIGYGIDRLVGTVPVFTIILAIVGVVAVFATFWVRYEVAMRRHDAEMEQRWAKRS